VHDLLVLRDTRDFTQTVRRFVGGTLGVPDVAVWMPPLDNPTAFFNVDDDKRLVLPEHTRRALVQRDCATIPEDAQLDPRLYPMRGDFEALFADLTAEVVLPLVDEGRLIGLVTLGYKESFDEFYDQDLQFLDALRRSTTLSLSNTLQYELARTGKPVKVYDREEFDEAVARQWAQARRSNEALSLVLLRLEDAERVDGEYGKGKAAAMIKELGDKLRPTLRGRDLPAYFDAHTLALLLPHTGAHGAEVAGRRLRIWLESNAVEIDGDTVLGKFGLGIATRTEAMPGPAQLGIDAQEALADATAVVRG
jgi:diguanylate cyclase (GGDEF)-like protein